MVTRRQERGLRRMELLLDAAAAVFGEVGYEAATTNAIAARAEVSPGTLYQFFRNKEAMAEALATRYTTELSRAHAEAFDSLEGLPLTEQVERVVVVMLEFNLEHPGFKALFETRPDMPEHVVRPARALHEEFMGRVVGLVSAGMPEGDAAQHRRTAEVLVHMFRGMVPLVAASDGAEREAMVAEVRRALRGYVESAG